MINWILLGVSILFIVVGYMMRRKKVVAIALVAIGGFLFTTRLLSIIFGPQEAEQIKFSIMPDRTQILGFSVSYTIIFTWIAMAVLIIAALIIRFTIFKNPKEKPEGAQNAVELVIETVANYTDAKAHGTGEFLCSYILTIGSLLVMSAFLELFRVRPPTADITMTFSLALITFIFINVYGLKKKGIIGRIKSLASPTPIVFPFRIISDLAIPISLACRLFGNMLGGMIVIDLLYTALGSNAVGIPSVFGLYFNVFHPLIQTYIFVTLTLTFINEAIE